MEPINKEHKSNQDNDFGTDDERYYFKNEARKSSSFLYFILIIFIVTLCYILQINWVNLNQYNAITSAEKYPIEQVVKEQISYFGKNYQEFKEKSEVNIILSEKEKEKFWNNCVGSCEIPATNRFKLISEKQNFINWACNERMKEEHFSGTKYTKWKLNVEGCILSNLEEVKQKDKEEISSLKWEKQKEMEIYLVGFLIIFLLILNIVRKIIKKK